MTFKLCNRLALPVCLVAAFTFLSAGPLTPAVHAAPVLVSTEASQGPASDAFPVGGDASAFALDSTYVVREQQPALKTGSDVRRVRSFREKWVARYYRVRSRCYRALHLTPRPGIDPLLVLGMGLFMIAVVVARQLGLFGEAEGDTEHHA